MRKNIRYWVFFIITAISIAVIVLNYTNHTINSSINLQYILGSISGVLLGVGISELILNIRNEPCWQRNTNRINHVLLLVWGGFILAFTISFMFPHIIDNIFNHRNWLQISDIFTAIQVDINKFWYAYVFFFITLIIWFFLLLHYERGEKRPEEKPDSKDTNIQTIKSKELPIFSLTIAVISIICLIFLKCFPIRITGDEYYFFNYQKCYEDPFIFIFLIGIFTVIGSLAWYFIKKVWFNALGSRIKEWFKEDVKYR